MDSNLLQELAFSLKILNNTSQINQIIWKPGFRLTALILWSKCGINTLHIATTDCIDPGSDNSWSEKQVSDGVEKIQ